MLEDWECDDYIWDTNLNLTVKLEQHKCICVSVSGGADSDCIIHLLSKFPEYKEKIHYVFCNTGLEYRATLRHLDELEQKYNIKIKRLTYKDGLTPIPLAVKQHGIPFISKRVSDNLTRLNRHGFNFKDGSFEELQQKFSGCKSALGWWCNAWGDGSSFNIVRNKGLKEFLIANPMPFKVSAECCKLSKKKPLMAYEKSIGADLSITGERKSEGGIRATLNKGCCNFKNGRDHYMPLFWWNDDVKAYYKEKEGIKYSDCYEVYGLKRTGCVGCPFALKREEELAVLQKYEPNLYHAVMNVFGESYAFTDKYKEFRKRRSE